MKHIKTYEGFIGNIWFNIFSNKYMKRIVLNFDKLLKTNNELAIMVDILGAKQFFDWSYENKNVVFLYISENHKAPPDFAKRHVEILAENQWLQIRIANNSEVEQIDYLESLLIKYGKLNNPAYNAFFNNYFLTLPNAEKVISELNVEDFLTSKNMKKFNI